VAGGLILSRLIVSGAGSINVDGAAYSTNDLSITATDSNAFDLVAGDPAGITYKVTVENNGLNTITGAQLADVLPAGFTMTGYTVVSTTGATSTHTGFVSATDFSDTVTLDSGASIVYFIAGHTDPTARGALEYTVTVTPPVGVTDLNLVNNVAIDSHQVAPA
jgi:uncharacterized repeat protein (TIGR01451 family)